MERLRVTVVEERVQVSYWIWKIVQIGGLARLKCFVDDREICSECRGVAVRGARSSGPPSALARATHGICANPKSFLVGTGGGTPLVRF